jgi:hypothetical protein
VTVILDKAWADLLGVRRESGAYRISRRELLARLARLRQAHPAPLRAPVSPVGGPDHVVVVLPPDNGPDHVVVVLPPDNGPDHVVVVLPPDTGVREPMAADGRG